MTPSMCVVRAAVAAALGAQCCMAAQAQSAGDRNAASGVYAGLGTTGLTLGVAHSYSAPIGARAEMSFASGLSRSFTENGIDYTGTLRSVRGAVLLDWHPMRGGLRLSAGLSANNAYGDFTGAPPSGTTITIGGTTVSAGPADQYTVRFELPTAMPYVGLGWGHTPQRGWGFHADAGVLIGTPSVTGALSPSLRAKITLAGGDPDAELARELQTLRDGVANIDAYPVLSIGVSYRW